MFSLYKFFNISRYFNNYVFSLEVFKIIFCIIIQNHRIITFIKFTNHLQRIEYSWLQNIARKHFFAENSGAVD